MADNLRAKRFGRRVVSRKTSAPQISPRLPLVSLPGMLTAAGAFPACTSFGPKSPPVPTPKAGPPQVSLRSWRNTNRPGATCAACRAPPDRGATPGWQNPGDLRLPDPAIPATRPGGGFGRRRLAKGRRQSCRPHFSGSGQLGPGSDSSQDPSPVRHRPCHGRGRVLRLLPLGRRSGAKAAGRPPRPRSPSGFDQTRQNRPNVGGRSFSRKPCISAATPTTSPMPTRIRLKPASSSS